MKTFFIILKYFILFAIIFNTFFLIFGLCMGKCMIASILNEVTLIIQERFTEMILEEEL